MKDNATFERMQATALRSFPAPPAGVEVRLVCQSCGSECTPGDELCPGCGFAVPPLPRYWWVAVPEKVQSVRIHFDPPGANDLTRGAARAESRSSEVDLFFQETEPRSRWNFFPQQPRTDLHHRMPPSTANSKGWTWRHMALGEWIRIAVFAPPAAGRNLLELLPERVGLETGLPPNRLAVQHASLSAVGSVNCFLGEGSRPLMMVRIPFSGRALARCEQNTETLMGIGSENRLPKDLAAILPRSHGTLEILRWQVFVETVVPGFPPPQWAGWLHRRALRRRAAKFLRDLHTATRRETYFDDDSFQDRLGHYCDRVYRSLQGSRDAETVLRLRDRLHKEFVGRHWPLVVEHGDFHLRNCLFEKGREGLTGVVDWDLGSPRGLPLVDLLHLLVTSEGPARLDRNTARRILRGGMERESTRMISDYLRELGLGMDASEPLILVYILAKLLVTFVVREGRSRERWKREVLLPTLDAL